MIGAIRHGGGGNNRFGSQQGGIGAKGGGQTSIGQPEEALEHGAPIHTEAKTRANASIEAVLPMICPYLLIRLLNRLSQGMLGTPFHKYGPAFASALFKEERV
ncbi:MAG: hypothetical protein AB1733_04425 [Thermodesulfobacteriota bacterium]